MASRLTTPSTWAKAIVDNLEDNGFDPDPLLQSLNMKRDRLNDPSEVFLQDQVTQLWELAATSSNDEFFGLKTGSRVQSTSYPELGYLLMSCPDLITSLKKIQEHQSLLAEGFHVEIMRQCGVYEVQLKIINCTLPPSQHAVDAMIVSLIQFLQWLTQKHVRPLEVGLRRVKPQDPTLFDQLFQSPTLFSQSHNYIKISEKDALQPLLTANPILFQMYSDPSNIKGIPSYSSRIQSVLYEETNPDNWHQDFCAKQLHISASTLKRRLKLENTTFNQVLSDTRCVMAKQLLQDKRQSMHQIAHRLGFTEISSFNRAFKRWTGTTPKGWQKQQAS